MQFALRRAVLGRVRLRRGLPHVAVDRDECTYYSKLFNACMPATERTSVRRVIDVGCRNWSYVSALAQAFPSAELLGVEVDGWRRYWNMWRRIDYAAAHAAQLMPPARVVLGDFCDIPITPCNGVTVMCFIFPFVTPYPCLRWGLPERYAHYPRLLEHAAKFAASGPTRWLCVHQGDWEAEAVAPIYAEMGCSMHQVKLTPQAWQGVWDSPHDNWVFYGAAGL